jgi:hypothetical protein
MNAARKSRLTISWFLWCAAGLICFVAVWNYVYSVWPTSVTGLSDLYPRWYGSRELWLHGRDPYSAQITREIQQFQRGRAAAKGEDEGRFAYPIYVSVLLAPFAKFSFWVTSRVFFWLFLLCAGGSVALFLRVTGLRSSVPAMGLFLLYSLGSFPVAFGVRLGQFALLVALLVAACLTAVMADRLLPAGVLLAFSTIKPQLTILLVPWLLVWCVGEWDRRRKLFWGFFGTMAALLIASEFLVPTWIPEFLAGSSAYTDYTYSRSVLMLLLSREGGIVASVLALAAILTLCAGFRRQPAGTVEFAFSSSLVLATTLVVIPTLSPHGQVLLLPGVFLLIRKRKEIWAGGWWQRRLLLTTAVLAAWPYVFAIAFSIVAWRVSVDTARHFWLVPVAGTILLPLMTTITLIATRRCIIGGSQPEVASTASAAA